MNKFKSLIKTKKGYAFTYLYGLCEENRGYGSSHGKYEVCGVVTNKYLLLSILVGFYKMVFDLSWECPRGKKVL